MKAISYFECDLWGDIIYDGRLAKGTIYHLKHMDGKYDVYEDGIKVHSVTSEKGSMLFHYKTPLQKQNVCIKVVSKKGEEYVSYTRPLSMKNSYPVALTVFLLIYSICMTFFT